MNSRILSAKGDFIHWNKLFWTLANDGHGPLHYIAPQTRLRIVDNSPWSSIAPSNPTPSTTGSPNSAGKDQGSKKKPGLEPVSKVKQLNVRNATGSLAAQFALPKPGLCIRVYNKRNRGQIGDKVLVAVNGQKKKGWIVASRLPSKDGWPRFESNDIVLVDDEGNPLGTRILVPIPAKLKSLSGDINKILSIATTFV